MYSQTFKLLHNNCLMFSIIQWQIFGITNIIKFKLCASVIADKVLLNSLSVATIEKLDFKSDANILHTHIFTMNCVMKANMYT